MSRRRTRGRLLPLLTALLAVGVLAGTGACSAGETTGGTTGETPGASDRAGEAGPPAPRDLYRQPFAWDSPWNLPLADSARYEPFDSGASKVYLDIENISVDPQFPIKKLTAEGDERSVHVDPDLGADGSYNNCSTFLTDAPDRATVAQGQPLKLEPGGDPSYEHGFADVSLRGTGLPGCHGGSGLSGIGGSVRTGEVSGASPIPHALKISLNCVKSCSTEGNGFRWPATKADRYFAGHYGGKVPGVRMGSLMAIPPDADLSGITSPDTRKIAEAMQTYGAYVVDDTFGDETNSLSVQAGVEKELPSMESPEMAELFSKLALVPDNAPTTPGGGALGTPRRAPCAGAFTDGTGGAPAGC